MSSSSACSSSSWAQQQQHQQQQRRRINNFENSKNQCLGKRDKSSAGRIDPKAVDICAVINELPQYYTTSSCAGRCFLYRGPGIKSTNEFTRFRVSHDTIEDARRYFDLSTLSSDPTGGADPVRSIGQFEHAERLRELGLAHAERMREMGATDEAAVSPSEVLHVDESSDIEAATTASASTSASTPTTSEGDSVWLRFEPFILHVACVSQNAASDLMAAARPAFKNVGLTTWKDSKFLVAIWGDEGLDMPLSTPGGGSLLTSSSPSSSSEESSTSLSEWLATLLNERHERNWNKITRFVKGVREMPPLAPDVDQVEASGGDLPEDAAPNVPRSFDVVGDVALLHTIQTDEAEERQAIGQAIMRKNKGIKVVAVRENNLGGTERAPGDQGLSIIAGDVRSPLITSHCEYGIKCVVNLTNTFFSPRMGPERLRLCQQVARGENVLVLFAGVGMEALQIAGRTEASSVLAVELNSAAVECAQRAHRMLERNKTVKCVGAADRMEIVQGDVFEVIPTLQKNFYDRVLAPRPKEGAMDGDLGSGDGGSAFLQALLPVMKQDGGECHWYDFAADHEFPDCDRTRRQIEQVCETQGLSMEVIHVANVGSIAKRQLRVCMDFRIFPTTTTA
jgi:tRNA G37 N-methylase Trm5/tRNA(Phe) wybutosine-synthesizing methylase Tyw3